MSKYAIGIDFGTLSGRAVLVNVGTGEELATSVCQYANGVIDQTLPASDIKLPHDWALQDPRDYLRVVYKTIPAVIKQGGVNANDIIGIGTDFTACTMLPVKKDGRPLCTITEFKDRPHAWVKLWKHHAAQPEANKINEIANNRDEGFIKRCGGKYSSEWFFSKLWQILDEDETIYNAADIFVEAADWIVWQLTGNYVRNECTLGYKTMWIKDLGGFPGNDFFKALDPRLENVTQTKLRGEILPLGARAGTLTAAVAKKLGLPENVAVCAGNVDAHAAVPACTVTTPGKMVMIMGTSVCHMVLDHERTLVPGMCGVVQDGMVPGLWGVEAGQSAVGDIYGWFVHNFVPDSVRREANRVKMSAHDYLTLEASKLRPGQSGLLALDWFNGNRSILVDADLSGLIVGMTLATQAHEVYRSLIEATAFGTYKILRTFEESGVKIDELYACGGLSERNNLVMQIFSDVTGRTIKIARSGQAGALGSAMHAAVAAGPQAGGYADMAEAAKAMAGLKEKQYFPNEENHRIYDKLFVEYETLHDYFGRGTNDVMKRLRSLRQGW
ncbi:MAG: ribulokinase [Phycisphaerae bacterium]